MGLIRPCFADELIGCEASQALEAFSGVVGGDEVVEVSSQLIVAVVVEAPDGGVLDGAVHPLDLTVRPGMVDPGEAKLDAMVAAVHGEHVGHGPGRGPIGMTGCEAELDAVIGQHRMDPVGHGRDEGFEEGGRGDAIGAFRQLDQGELAGSVYRDEQVELAFGGLQLGDVDVEEADRVGLELLLGGFLTFDIGEPADTVAL